MSRAYPPAAGANPEDIARALLNTPPDAVNDPPDQRDAERPEQSRQDSGSGDRLLREKEVDAIVRGDLRVRQIEDLPLADKC
ncbi:MAG: hypothetical protein F4160_05255 [Rhodospirillaceae bacterium]|nr:hypothetical protein [Rhodospirillaceae bacterium]MYH36191.1 hypothetical protein [Rhodospirillaceae bacterium]MYK16183.1 hypothetical protein [Rhodospirillaceae bacterium]